MNELLKSKKITSDKDLTGLCNSFDNTESHVHSLQGLGIESKNYGSLLAPIILERLPHQLKVIISRNLKSELWDLDKILWLINDELRAQESCIFPSNSFNSTSNDQKQGGKNNLSYFESPTSGSALYSNQTHQNKSAFCRGNHWSDKCKVISEPEARKEYLRKGNGCFLCLNQSHISRNCPKTKTCYYCKDLHNSTICTKKKDDLEKLGNPTDDTNTNAVHNKTSVLFQTAEILIGNPQNNQIVKIRALFDSGSQRTFISERVTKILKLTSEGKENISLNTFANSESRNSFVDHVKLNILPRVDNKNKSYEISALCLPLICLPLKKQPRNYVQNLPEFAELKFVDTGDNGYEIDLVIGSDFYWSLLREM